MLLRQMQYFTAVIECGSFTEAARRCYISQSAVSQQVRALEAELGIQLLHRKNRSFSLTPAGDYFYRHSRMILDEAEAICRETGRIGQGERPKLTIGCPRCFDGQELYAAAAAFSERFPGAQLHILRGSQQALANQLRSGGVDMLLTGEADALSGEFACLPLFRRAHTIELSARSPLCARPLVPPQALRHLPCILIAPPGEQEAGQALYPLAPSIASRFLFAKTLEEGRLLAAGGQGFLPVEGASLPPPPAALCRLSIGNGSPLFQSYCALWRQGEHSGCREEFIRLLRIQADVS